MLPPGIQIKLFKTLHRKTEPDFVPNPTATSCVLGFATLVSPYRREAGSVSTKEQLSVTCPIRWA